VVLQQATAHRLILLRRNRVSISSVERLCVRDLAGCAIVRKVSDIRVKAYLHRILRIVVATN
jgi:hypothetical protein